MNRIFSFLIGSMALALFAACTNDTIDEVSSSLGEYVYELNLHGQVQDYEGGTRATKSWKNGDVIYLRFAVSGSMVLGKATYSGSGWTLTTDKVLTGSGSCTAVEIDNASSSTSTTVTLTPQSAAYMDSNGQWSLSGNTMTARVNLTPLLGRLRFKGSSGTNFTLSGLTTYISYNVSTGFFASSTMDVSGTIASSGYSPYIYGLLEGSNRTLTTNGYTMDCPSTMMQSGRSGWLNYPTSSSHTGWYTSGSSNSGHEYVDLGLSVKWATCNVGASSPEEYGDCYAWGETAKKDTYNWSTYKWCNGSETTMTKYCNSFDYGTVDNKTTLDPEDDVAHVKWGGDWRMPTKAELDELRDTNNCTWTWTTQGGKNGYKVISKKNGNSIFLPAAGYRSGSSLYDASSVGYYWSSSLYTSYSILAYYLHFFSGGVGWDYSGRYHGRSVRPVCP